MGQANRIMLWKADPRRFSLTPLVPRTPGWSNGRGTRYLTGGLKIPTGRRQSAEVGRRGDHPPVLGALAGRFGNAQPTSCFEALTPAPGAYLLVVALSGPLALPRPALKSARLGPGHYLYAGSALGSGGIRARALRHARKGKRRHWHIDHLTEAGTLLAALALPGMGECDVVRSLLALPGVTVPVPGFGSSDCRACPAHLLAAPGPGNAPEFPA